MATTKEVFEDLKGDKSVDTSTKTDDSKEKNEIMELKAQYEKEIADLRKNSENYQTEALKLRQDLSENMKFAQSLLDKDKEIPSQDLTDEELLDAINSTPNKTLKGLIAKQVKKEADKHIAEMSKVTAQIGADSRKTSVELARGKVESKYDGFEEDWPKLVEWGEKYRYHTKNASDPEQLEAFYVMYKHLNKEPLKLKSKGISEEDFSKILSKKLAAGLSPSELSDGETPNLTPDQKSMAARYNLSDEDYVKYSNPEMTLKDHNKLKGGK